MSFFNQQAQPGLLVAADAPLSERLAFIKKVYSLLTLSIFAAVITAYLTLNTPALFNLAVQYMLFWVILEIGVLLVAMFMAKKETVALIAMFSFTVLTGFTTSPIIHVYRDVVGLAGTLTLVAFGSLTAIAFFSKKDFNFLGRFLFIGLIVLVVGGLLNAFIFKNGSASFFMAIGSVVIFSGFILYDTSNIMRRYPTDMYVSATLGMYLNILNLFIALLRILGNRD